MVWSEGDNRKGDGEINKGKDIPEEGVLLLGSMNEIVYEQRIPFPTCPTHRISTLSSP